MRGSLFPGVLHARELIKSERMLFEGSCHRRLGSVKGFGPNATLCRCSRETRADGLLG